MKTGLRLKRHVFLSVGIVFIFVTSLQNEVTASTLQCTSPEQFLCDDGKCITRAWKCDGANDCDDGSDERECAEPTCSSTEFACKDGSKCLVHRWQCDKEKDCTDGSDEDPQACGNLTCGQDQFQCGPGLHCISKDWVCDEQEECVNGADEKNCEVTTTCASDEFLCVKSKKCIEARWRCDQDHDCYDGSDTSDNSDEDGCGAPTCQSDEFRCTNGHCISKRWACDGDFDCTDKSDEANCTNGATIKPSDCGSRAFKCNNDRCIHTAWTCDGDKDCDDGEDELAKLCPDNCKTEGKFMCNVTRNCLYPYMVCDGNFDCQDGSDEAKCFVPTPDPCDMKTMFKCSKDSNFCIRRDKVCDGTHDCPSAEDESFDMCSQPVKPCLSNPCKTPHSNATNVATCKDLKGNAFYCSCASGYLLEADGVTCKDIDECKIPGTCSHECKNTFGGYKCVCFPGYDVDAKTGMCKAKHGHTALLFTNRNDIRMYNLSNKEYKSLVHDAKSAVAVDFDIRGRRLFWSDVAYEKLYMAPMQGDLSQNSENVTALVETGISTPDGLAYDWIHDNLYWTDTGLDKIEVYSLKTSARKVLFEKTGLDEPRAIVLDPFTGNMYWSDWGEYNGNPAIHKGAMDGSSSNKFIYGDTELMWPNGLTIDYSTRTLFWVDAKLLMIGSKNLDTLNYRAILKNLEMLRHPFAITVFEDFLFWTDWQNEAIHSVNKFTGGDVSNVSLGLYSPMDIHVYHPLRQPTANNFCKSKQCSHMCLPRPRTLVATRKEPGAFPVRCVCPEGLVLLTDLRTCNKTRTRPIPAVTTTKPTPAPKTTPRVHTERAHVTGASGVKSTSSQGESGRVAGITIGVVCAVLLVLALVGVVVFKYIKKRNIQSMNFDNPVYRKTTTTDDHVTLEKSQYQPSRRKLPPSLQPLTSPDTNETV